MKYVNSLKYMNGFSSARSESDISRKRVSELCMSLGRINRDMRYVCLPHGAAGRATAAMLESILSSAGYRVGRISSAENFDSRTSVYLNGRLASIEDYNKAVAELKSAVQRSDESFFAEEVTFVLSLLLCKLADCDYVILEGLGDGEFSLDAVCAPYDLIIIPTVYEGSEDTVRPVCEAIRRGVREVISGNQKIEIYNAISNACATSGIRLYIPVKSQFEVTETSLIKTSFNYGGRENYTLKSPSHVVRDCAMIAIEASLAIRRAGIKLPWSTIVDGLSNASNHSCFNVISAAPVLVTDCAETHGEAVMLRETLQKVAPHVQSVILCIGCRDAACACLLASPFADLEIREIIVCGEDGGEDGSFDKESCPVTSVNGTEAAAKLLLDRSKAADAAICFGSVHFEETVNSQLKKLLSY